MNSSPNYLFLLIPILTGSLSQLFFKRGLLTMGDFNFSLSNIFPLIWKILQNGWLLAGIFTFGISFLTYLSVLSKYQLSVVYPIFVSSGIVIISLVSWILFRETLSLMQILGIVAIVFGIFLLIPRS